MANSDNFYTLRLVKPRKSRPFYVFDEWERWNDMVPCPFSLLISGLERKLTQGLCLSKISRENTFLWLEAWYGGYDHGNNIRNLLLWSLFFFTSVTIVYEMAKTNYKKFPIIFFNIEFDCEPAINSATISIFLDSLDLKVTGLSYIYTRFLTLKIYFF